ncbi:MAG: hypothetical protein NXI30_02565 [bacterium]|nr:hypothetical protein [bacterium]
MALIFCLAAAPASSQECACGDGNTPVLGCCGGDGQRLCSLSIFSDCQTACVAPAEISDLGVNCAIPRKIGESCSAFRPCDGDTAACYPTPAQGLGSQTCLPNEAIGSEPWNDAVCLSLFDPSRQNAVLAQPNLGAQSFGTGVALAAGVAGFVEVGVVYGTGGEYGCYRSECFGGQTNVSVGVFGCEGRFESWEAVASTTPPETGSSFLVVGSGSVGLGASVGVVLDNGTQVGSVGCALLEIGVLPVDIGTYQCTTQRITYLPGFGSRDEAYVDFSYEGVEQGSEFAPASTLILGWTLVEENGVVRIRPGTSSETLLLTGKNAVLAVEGPGGDVVIGVPAP